MYSFVITVLAFVHMLVCRCARALDCVWFDRHRLLVYVDGAFVANLCHRHTSERQCHSLCTHTAGSCVIDKVLSIMVASEYVCIHAVSVCDSVYVCMYECYVIGVADRHFSVGLSEDRAAGV